MNKNKKSHNRTIDRFAFVYVDANRKLQVLWDVPGDEWLERTSLESAHEKGMRGLTPEEIWAFTKELLRLHQVERGGRQR